MSSKLQIELDSLQAQINNLGMHLKVLCSDLSDVLEPQPEEDSKREGIEINTDAPLVVQIKNMAFDVATLLLLTLSMSERLVTKPLSKAREEPTEPRFHNPPAVSRISQRNIDRSKAAKKKQ